MNVDDLRKMAAARFRPDHVRLLLVAETPPTHRPPDPPRYFYFEHVSKHDHLFRAIVKAVFEETPARESKAAILGRLRDHGIYLIDLKPDPSDPRAFSEFVPSLVERCMELRPERIILIKANVFDEAFPALHSAGLPVVNIRVPFPSSGRQREFEAAFREALATHAKGEKGRSEIDR